MLRPLLALAASAALASCAAASSRQPAAAPPAASAPVHRIVSLVPSLTEDLFAVGAGASVVGVSAYSDYPPAARRLPVIASFASLDAERIVALHPDVVVGISAQGSLTRDLERAHVATVLLRDDSLDDVFANLDAVGTLTGHGPAARALIGRVQARTRALTRAVPHRARKPSLFVVLGDAPIYTVGRGSYIASLIALAGATNAAADVRAPYARYSAEALVARQPDALVVDPDVRLSAAFGRAPWNALRAVREHRVYTLPDAAILERPGPRYNDGLAWLIATLRKVPS